VRGTTRRIVTASWHSKFRDLVAANGDAAVRRLQQREARLRGDRLAQEEEDLASQQDRKPVPPQHWIENDYFSGSLARSLYPGLKYHFVDIVERKVPLIILHGATRWGKTFITKALKGRSVYEVSCKANPQRSFGLDDMSVLLYLNMNVKEKKAKDAFFTSFSSWVRSTKYFANEFPPVPHVKNELRFPKNILSKYSGPLVNAAESEDLFFFVGDEANEYDVVQDSKRAREGSKYDAAEEISTAVIRRMQGTYMDKGTGEYPSACKVIWLCKERYPDSFIPRMVEEVQRDGLVEAGLAVTIRSTEWGFKDLPKDIRYFYIRTGTRTESAKIIEDEMDAEKARTKARRLVEDDAPADERFEVCDVPTVYRRTAEKNLEMFVRDMCGIPTRAISVFFREREVIFRAQRSPGDEVCTITVPQEVCVHPFTEEYTNTADGVELIRERLCHRVKTGNVAFNQTTGREGPETIWRPHVSAGVPRFAGCDAGLSGDAFGFAVGHRVGWKKVLRLQEAEPVEVYAPVTWIDLMLRIIPPPDGQIPFAYACGLIYHLARIGFGFAKVTCDSYQHVALTQPLEDHGYDTEVVSMDRTPDAYNLLHLAYREGRVSTYSFGPLEEELSRLERVVTNRTLHGVPLEKIDHPPNFSKDISDAVAQVVMQVETESESFLTEDMRKAEAIEGRERRPMVEAHKREHTKAEAFADGDFVRLKKIIDAETDDY